jgi:translation elongation factor EF-G
MIDPFVGKVGIFRVHQGTITRDTQLFIGDGRKPFKVAHLYQLQGKEHAEISRAIPGDICAVSKVDELHFDAVLHDSHDEDNYHLKSITFPPAMAGLAIEPERRGEEQKLSDALHKLTAEDPCVRVEHHSSLNETVLYGMGDLHLRVMLQRMADRYGVKCKTHVPSIPYKETITKPAPGHHRHKKQTGGAGQFGEVYLRVEPLERGQGFEFVDDVVGGAIPSQFIPAIDNFPMLPVVAGDKATVRQIWYYTLITVAATVLLFYPLGASGVLYAAIALSLGGFFIHKSWRLLQNPEDRTVAKELFLYSISYMMLLCLGMVVDSLPITHSLITAAINQLHFIS